MRFLLENKNNILDHLSDICIAVDKKRSGDGGNCGNFALALARELSKRGIDSKIVIASSFDYDPELDKEMSVRDLSDAEPDIYHVMLMIDDKFYDKYGLTDSDVLFDIAEDQYGDPNPDISVWNYFPEVDDDFRFVFEWDTNHNTSVEYFQKLFDKEIKKYEGEV